MWSVVMFVIVAGLPPFQVSDTFGPYVSKSRCEIRAQQIERELKVAVAKKGRTAQVTFHCSWLEASAPAT